MNIIYYPPSNQSKNERTEGEIEKPQSYTGETFFGHLSWLLISNRRIYSKDTENLNKMINKFELTDINRRQLSNNFKYTLFASADGIFKKTGPM